MPEQDAEHYSSLAARYEHAFSANPGLTRFIQAIISHLPSHSTLLDVGCGTGKPVAVSMTAAGHHVTGIDFSPEMLKLSKQAVPTGTFELVDMRNYSPPEGTQFDAILDILSLFVLERHEIESLIQRQASWVKPGGLLCVATIAAENVSADKVRGRFDDDGLCAREIPWRFLGEDVAISALFTLPGWKKVLTDAGLEIVHTDSELYVAPNEADTDKEPQLFVISKKV